MCAMMATRPINIESAADAGKGPNAHRLNYRQWWLLGAAAVCGLVFSLALFWTLWHEEHEAARVQFQLEAGKKIEAIKQALANQLGVMSLFKAFYAGSFEVDRNEFNIFSVSVFEEHPEIKTLAWMPRVRAEGRSAFEAAIKKSGYPQFHITELRGGSFVSAAERKEYFPISFIEPQDKCQDMLGFDLGSLPDCLSAMDRAEGMRPPAISYTDIPGLDGNAECMIYMFDDAHNEQHPAANSDKSPRLSDGFILGVFQLRDVINRTLKLIQPAGVDVYLFDVTDPKKTRPICPYPSPIRATPLPVLESPPPESFDPIHYVVRFTVADRTWLAYCRPTDVYFSGKSRWAPPAALLAGLLIMGLIVGYLFLLTERTVRVERLVSERSGELQASEQRFRLLVENAADGFFLLDENGRILDVNQRATELLGYSREELLKMNVFDFEVAFKPEDHHEQVWRRPAADYPINVNGLHRRKDGSTYPVEVRLNCLDTGGKHLIMAVVRDVTERKAAEEALRKEQRFLRHLIDLQERERKLMAYEIHDGLAQQLTGAF